MLVNNAGLGHAAPLTSGETERWREMLDVNVLAQCFEIGNPYIFKMYGKK